MDRLKDLLVNKFHINESVYDVNIDADFESISMLINHHKHCNDFYYHNFEEFFNENFNKLLCQCKIKSVKLSGLDSFNFDVTFGKSGTDVLNKILNSIHTNKALFIHTAHEHPCVFEHPLVKASEQIVINLDDMEHLFDIDLLNQTNVNSDIDTIVLSVICTQSNTGDITPLDKIKNIQTKIKQILFENDLDIKFYTILDATQELFVLKDRDYSFADFIFGSGYLGFSPSLFGYLFYKKSQHKVIENLTTMDYFKTIKPHISKLNRHLNVVENTKLEDFTDRVNEFYDIINERFDLDFKRVTNNDQLNQINTLFYFHSDKLDLSDCHYHYTIRDRYYNKDNNVALRIAYCDLMEETLNRFPILIYLYKIIEFKHEGGDFAEYRFK